MTDRPPETVFRARTLPGGRIGRFLLILWLAGMGGMTLGLLLTFGNVIGGMVGLLAPMVWLGIKRTRRAEFGVGADGVRETLLDAQGKADGVRERRYRWDEVESWLVDSDMVRGLGVRRFVEVRLRDGYRMRVREANDAPNDPEFTAFAAALEAHAGGAATSVAHARPPASPPPVPTRRRSFYERPIAKILTLAFLILTAGLLVAAVLIPQHFSGGAWFKLLVVVVPGTLYMTARTFGRR